MALNNKELTNVAMFGAAAGVATPFLLSKVVIPVLGKLAGFIPAISLKLADASPGTISVSVRDSLTGLNGGLAGWLMDAMHLTVNIPGTMYIMAALGGALMMVLGAYVADMLGFLKGSSWQKSAAVIFTGNLVAGLILGWSTMSFPALNIDFVNVLLAFTLNAVILGWGWVELDKKLGFGLVPF